MLKEALQPTNGRQLHHTSCQWKARTIWQMIKNGAPSVLLCIPVVITMGNLDLWDICICLSICSSTWVWVWYAVSLNVPFQCHESPINQAWLGSFSPSWAQGWNRFKAPSPSWATDAINQAEDWSMFNPELLHMPVRHHHHNNPHRQQQYKPPELVTFCNHPQTSILPRQSETAWSLSYPIIKGWHCTRLLPHLLQLPWHEASKSHSKWKSVLPIRIR